MDESRQSRPGALSSFVRFVVCGGGIGLLSGAAVPLLATVMPFALANAVITVASTLLCTELHALFTFGAGRRPGRREHLQSAGSATAAYLVTCAAMAVLHTVQPSAGLLTQQTVYLGASALAGTARFLILRLYVFTARAVPLTVDRDSTQQPPEPPLAPGPTTPTGGPSRTPSTRCRPLPRPTVCAAGWTRGRSAGTSWVLTTSTAHCAPWREERLDQRRRTPASVGQVLRGGTAGPRRATLPRRLDPAPGR